MSENCERGEFSENCKRVRSVRTVRELRRLRTLIGMRVITVTWMIKL